MSQSAWWAGVKQGRYPAPVKLGPGLTAWKAEDVRALVERIATKGGQHEAPRQRAEPRRAKRPWRRPL